MKYQLFLSHYLNEKRILSTDFRKKKCSNVKFSENQSGGSRVVPYGQTDMAKLIIAV